MGGSTKCYLLEDKGPMCPRRGRDGRVGPPGANRCLVVMLQGLIIELLAIFWVRRAGGRKKIAHWAWRVGKIIKSSGSLNQLENWVDRRQRGKECAASMRAASSVLSKTPLFAYVRSSLRPRSAI